MDRAYESDDTRWLVLGLGMVPAVAPKRTRLDALHYDRALYKSVMKSNASFGD